MTGFTMVSIDTQGKLKLTHIPDCDQVDDALVGFYRYHEQSEAHKEHTVVVVLEGYMEEADQLCYGSCYDYLQFLEDFEQLKKRMQMERVDLFELCGNVTQIVEIANRLDQATLVTYLNAGTAPVLVNMTADQTWLEVVRKLAVKEATKELYGTL